MVAGKSRRNARRAFGKRFPALPVVATQRSARQSGQTGAMMTSPFRVALGLGAAMFFLASVADARPAPVNASRDALMVSSRALSPRTNRVRTWVSAPSNQGVSRSNLEGGTIRSAASAGGLSFQFSGYSADQQNTLSNFLNGNLGNISTVWGDPAPEQQGKTLTISNVAGSATYFPPAASNSTAGGVEFGYVAGASASENQFALLELVLRAYQGPRIPAFDFNNGLYVEPYLYGASEAAALRIIYLATGSPAAFDPTVYAAYLLPVYDTFNSPALGNAFIYPQSGDLAVSDFRLAMAQAAFLKISVEKPDFFRVFNAALYARGQARTAISTDDLESLVASVVPSVEGISTRAWLREQGALNARVATGDKVYLAVLPLPVSSTTASRFGFNAFALAFSTQADGNETPLSGYGTLDAFDETGRNIKPFSPELTSSNVLPFAEAGSVLAGQATFVGTFTPWSSPAPSRVTLRARFNATEGKGVFPFGVAGTTSSVSSFYGATLGANVGNLSISGASGSETVPITRGTFAPALPYPSGPAVKTSFSDGTRTVSRNTAWLVPGSSARSVAFLLDGVGSSAASSPNLSATNGNLKMIAFPLRPFVRDEALALGADAASLALARYRPNLSPASATSGGGLQFGVDPSRYEIYPHISQGPEAGQGYWILVPQSGLNTQVAGTFPPTDQNAEVELRGGWNQFGVPRATAVGALNIQVRYGGFSAVSLAEAQNRGIVAPGVWRYNGTNGYERVDVAGGVLNPWEGYWIFASPPSGVNLVFAPGAGAPLVRAGSAFGASGEWQVGLVAASSRSRDSSATFGISSKPSAARPPVATRQLSVYFSPTTQAAKAGTGDAQGFLPRLGRSNFWRFSVDGAAKGERVSLLWPTIARAPRTLRLLLRDDATGKTMWMRAGGGWSFLSNGTPRRFSIWGGAFVFGASSAPSS